MEKIFHRRDPSPIYRYKMIMSKEKPDGPQPSRVREEELDMPQNGFYNEKIDDVTDRRCCKINRIPIHTTADVKVVNVYSPSLIFVRIGNTIRDNLILREPSNTKPLELHELKEYYYVLCPVEERAYGRARIIKIEDDPDNFTQKLVQLILIDDGVIVWANSSSLISMDPEISTGAKDLAYHPWQIQAISIAGVYPKKTPKNRDRMWTEEVRNKLKNIIERYDNFKVKAAMLSLSNNDYGVATAVSLFGLRVRKEVEEEGKRAKYNIPPEENDIGSILAGCFPYEVETIRLYDGKKQERFENKLSDKEKENEKVDRESYNHYMEEWRKRCIPEWKPVVEEEVVKVGDWLVNLDDIEIKDMTYDWLIRKKYGYIDDTIAITLESAHTNSPWEFYGRPIKMMVDKEEADKIKDSENIEPVFEIEVVEGVNRKDNQVRLGQTEAMVRENDIFEEHMYVMDQFYNKDWNRRQVTKHEIEEMLTERKRPFCICQAPESRKGFTGTWQRVEILEAKEIAAIVRFLDSGGTDMVMYGSLFHIHPDHTIWPSLCVQFCVWGWELDGGQEGESWRTALASEGKRKSMDAFRKIMREDLPLYMEVVPDHMIPRETFNQLQTLEDRRSEPIPYERKGVMFVTNIKVIGLQVEIMAEMKKEGRAKKNMNSPFPRKV